VMGTGGCVPVIPCGGVFQQVYPATDITGAITNPTVNPVNGKRSYSNMNPGIQNLIPS